MAAKKGALPWFLSVWLLGWSVGVGVISGLVGSQGGILWLFVFTHGGAEVMVGWLAAGIFERAMAETVGGVTTEASMSGITAQWRSRGKSVFMLVWFILLGLLMTAVLGVGTWGPVLLNEGETSRMVVASLLSLAWSVIAWRWFVALRSMIGMLGSFELSANFDLLTATHRRGVVEVVRELPMAGLKVTQKTARLTFTVGAESFSLPCMKGPERQALLSSLSELSQRAEAPGVKADIPSELASIMSHREPEAER